MNGVPRLTKEQATIIAAYTGVSCGPFPDVHAYAERVLGRRIMTHEFADQSTWDELRGAARADFLALCHDPELAR